MFFLLLLLRRGSSVRIASESRIKHESQAVRRNSNCLIFVYRLIRFTVIPLTWVSTMTCLPARHWSYSQSDSEFCDPNFKMASIYSACKYSSVIFFGVFVINWMSGFRGLNIPHLCAWSRGQGPQPPYSVCPRGCFLLKMHLFRLIRA